MNPQHINPVPKYIKDDKGNNIPRRAVAPYNFIELPDQVITVEPNSLPSGDRYAEDDFAKQYRLQSFLRHLVKFLQTPHSSKS